MRVAATSAGWMFGAGILALGTASLAVAAPEDLLPPGFGEPPPAAPIAAPAPVETPRAGTPTDPRTAPPATPQDPANAPVVQPVPWQNAAVPYVPAEIPLPADFPTLEELEEMEEDEINQLLGLRPKFDIPPAARRSMAQVGVIDVREGGFAINSLAGQPERLVRAALQASDGPVVSRWGHILLRRVLASRLDAPEGMDPVEFAALRVRALNAIGEAKVARALAQDVDGNNYDRALTDAAFAAYLTTGDVMGMCPVARLQPTIRDDGHWEMLQAICAANLGEARSANRRLQRALGTGMAEEIDVRLAQRYAGAAGDGSRAVTIEWNGVSQMSPWRHALARAVGEPIPEDLPIRGRYTLADAGIPAVPLNRRAQAGMMAGQRGILSAAAMVDLQSQLYASDRFTAADRTLARQLREAYVAETPAARLAALQQLWDVGGAGAYGRKVLTAYAAARFPVGEASGEDADILISSMLSAGLDRNAMRWSETVAQGSEGWGLLALADPRGGSVDGGALDSFVDDMSETKSAYLVAGLAGLGRIDDGDLSTFTNRLDLDLQSASAWSGKISRAGELRNQGLVALLAGLGMQGTRWEQMTPRHLYFITRALSRAGLAAEARMIAAEAVARG